VLSEVKIRSLTVLLSLS